MKVIFIVLSLAAFISCTLPVAKTSEGKTGQIAHSKGGCATCHASHNMGGSVLLNKPLNELCASCHPDRKGTGEHAIGIKPKTATDGLPVDKEGKITCITCHDHHGEKGYDRLMRTKSYTELCKKCHKGY